MERERHITENEEMLGKYVTRAKAALIAKLETQRTGVLHKPFFTHYMSAFGDARITCWTVIIDVKK